MDHSRTAGSRDVVRLMPDDLQFARPVRLNARFPHVNLLVIGPGDAVDELLAVVRSERLAASGDGGLVTVWHPGKPFVLPSPTATGLMILRDVDTLVHGDQHKLVDWLVEAAGRVQVVSTASASLMPLVDAGVFMQTLYYRLNTIYMDLTERRAHPYEW